MRLVEAALAVAVVAGLTYFAYTAAGDEFPLNVAIAVLGFVVACALMLLVIEDGRR